MLVVLDGVFNHTSAQHPWFRQARVDAKSRFRKRYYFEPDGTYETWANEVWSLPKLNWEEAELVPLVGRVLDYWDDLGVDGWRMDVANEIPRRAWMQLRAGRPRSYWIGEIWHEAPDWIGGEPLSGVMDYPLYHIVRDALLLGKAGARELEGRLVEHSLLYPAHVGALNWTLLSSHDIPRAVSLADGERDRVRSALVFQYAWQGTPYVYYGDERWVEGDTADAGRAVLGWPPERQVNPLLATLAARRRKNPWIAWARLERVEREEEVLVCRRVADDGPGAGGTVVLVTNLGSEQFGLDVRVWGVEGGVDLATGETVPGRLLSVGPGQVKAVVIPEITPDASLDRAGHPSRG